MKAFLKILSIAALLFAFHLGFAQSESDIDFVEDFNIYVKWKAPELKNTKTDNDGYWYYIIESNGFVEKSIDSTAILILEQTNKLDSKDVQYIELSRYSKNTGKKFRVKFPPCDSVGLNCPEITQSPIKPGYSYRVYFSDSFSSPSSIHQVDRGDGVLNLPNVPTSIDNIKSYVSVENLEQLKDENGQTYLNFSLTVLKKDSSTLSISLRSESFNEQGVKTEETYPIGQVSLSERKSYILDSGTVNKDFTNERFYVVLKRDGLLVGEIPVALRKAFEPNDNNLNLLGSDFVIQDQVSGVGFVSKDCGYNLLKGGRMCGLSDLLLLINRIIDYIFVLILPIASIVFVYVGYLYITSGGDPGKRSKAKSAMIKLVTGIVMIMAAWLIVRTILVSLGVGEEFLIFFDK